MYAKKEQTPAMNPNPVFNAAKDGTVIYTNEAGKPLLKEWGVSIGEKLPILLRDFVQRAVFQNIPEKIEVEIERRAYLLLFQPLPTEEHVTIYGYEISNQEKLEEALKEREEKLRHLIKHAPTGVFEIDFSGPKYVTVNDAFCQMSGYTREELLATSPFELMVDESKQKLNERLKKSLSGEEISKQEEYLVIGKNGRKLWVLIDAQFTYKNGKVAGAFVIAHDITERKLAEKTVCKSERHFRLLFENMLQGIVYHDADGRIISMNPAAETILGDNPAEFLGSSYVGENYYVIREDGSPFPFREHPAMISLMTGHEVHNIVMGIYSPQESCYRWINTSSIPIIVPGEDKPFQVYSLLEDITERRQAEEALRDSEEKYRNIVETANEGIFLVNKETQISYTNKRSLELLGHNLEETIGRSMWDFVSEESRLASKIYFEKSPNGITENYEVKLKCKDSSHIWALINTKPFFDNKGKLKGYLGMFTDITEKKVAEETLANIEIARKKEIHHRIKNNLQVISSLLDLQADKFKDRNNIEDSEILEAFRESQNRVISMALIHEELHKGGGFETLNFSPYIRELSENILQTYCIGNKNISLKMDLAENAFFDMDTAVPLGIIVNELVSNSFKHAFIGRLKGEIRIKLDKEENEEHMESIGEGSTCFNLTVSDNGIGIPEDVEVEKLESLGLQLVTTLVDQLEGKLYLKRNNGIEFSIRFKVAEEEIRL